VALGRIYGLELGIQLFLKGQADERFTRIDNLAHILVNYSTSVQPGEWVGACWAMWRAGRLVRAVYSKVIEAGGQSVADADRRDAGARIRASRRTTHKSIGDPAQSLYYDNADVYIRCTASPNTRAMTNIDAKRVQKIQAARRPWLETRMRRAAEGQMKWVGTLYRPRAAPRKPG